MTKFEFKTVVEKDVEINENYIPTVDNEYDEEISDEKISATIQWELLINEKEDGIFNGLDFKLIQLDVKYEWTLATNNRDGDRWTPDSWSHQEEEHVETFKLDWLLENDYKVEFSDEGDMLRDGLVITGIDVDTERKQIYIYFN